MLEQYSDSMNSEQAREQLSKIIHGIKDLVRPYMATKEGRDQIRQVFQCRIEGCEEEEKDFQYSPYGML